MKIVSLLTSAFVLSITLVLSGCNSGPETPSKELSSELVPMEKMGFLTVDSCAAQGAFLDCYLENYMCGTDGCFLENDAGVFTKVQLVLYSHEDGVSYNVDTRNIDMRHIDKGINRNDVTLIGDFNAATNTIIVKEFKAPPPPKKSFFKGCL
ncbi:MAG: hypothetical protein RBR59_02725 [Sulfurimonadaceae bacterium]|jgi:hypothetical protein|nr:hypothetical protein [Sulfurimonadaceae bacterium]